MATDPEARSPQRGSAEPRRAMSCIRQAGGPEWKAGCVLSDQRPVGAGGSRDLRDVGRKPVRRFASGGWDDADRRGWPTQPSQPNPTRGPDWGTGA
jgi:hypothetical protein